MSLPVSIHRIYDTSEMTSKSPLLTSIRYIPQRSRLASLLLSCSKAPGNLSLISPTFHFQTWHADWSLADQTISSVGPQTGGLFCGGEHGETTEGAGVPPKRSASAHLHRSWEPDHSAVRHGFPPDEERLSRRQRIGAPARLLRLMKCCQSIQPKWLFSLNASKKISVSSAFFIYFS